MPDDGGRKLKNLNGSLGRARTADLVINSHPLYQLSYQGINIKQAGNHTGRQGFRSTAFSCVFPVPYEHRIGFPSHRVRESRGRPVFERQITRGFTRFRLSQKVKLVFVPGLLPSGW
jgi:hypothetical protein